MKNVKCDLYYLEKYDSTNIFRVERKIQFYLKSRRNDRELYLYHILDYADLYIVNRLTCAWIRRKPDCTFDFPTMFRIKRVRIYIYPRRWNVSRPIVVSQSWVTCSARGCVRSDYPPTNSAAYSRKHASRAYHEYTRIYVGHMVVSTVLGPPWSKDGPRAESIAPSQYRVMAPRFEPRVLMSFQWD